MKMSYCATLAGFTQKFEVSNGKRLQLRLEKREEPVNESVTLVVVGVSRSRNMAEYVYVVYVLMAVKQDPDGVVKYSRWKK